MAKRNSSYKIETSSAWGLPLGYIIVGLGSLLFYGFLHLFWDDRFLMDFADLGSQGRSLWEGLGKVWFIFAWAIGVNIVYGLDKIDLPNDTGTGFSDYAIGGSWISLNAGFWEEIIFRWLMFFNAMVTAQFFNFLLGGFINTDYGFTKWFAVSVAGPVANFFTLGQLDGYLLGESNWVMATAIIVAAGKFRDGHKYQGAFGYVNSWFMGMVMFWLLLNYGLWAAIVAHIAYDATVYLTAGAMVSLRPTRRNPYGW